jgi:hypothetical protein
MAAQLEMVLWTSAIFISDVALAYIACEYDDFLGRMKYACFAITHGSLSRAPRLHHTPVSAAPLA